ncbi:MAG TPA: carbonic anhydrase family protein [Candidatus Sulfotelmatobacter sp.]|jgi:carbonic anhydrase|nr:carbonic anhydrase family protein [Candidatus Sulfotelmatobacter sp.]
MERRAFLRHFANAAVVCPVCSMLGAKAAFAAESHAPTSLTAPAPTHGEAAAHPPHWDYEGEGGPEKWGQLSSEYGACGLGREQSPINLDQPVSALLKAPALHWQAMPLEVVNNGHTIQVNCPKGSSLELDGTAYDLIQYHFHHPSEHTLAGTAFDMEVHFVHRAANGGLAVLGIMITKGEANSTLETVWRILPEKAGETAKADVQLLPSALIPADSATYRYAGSLTTPPCSEIVSWVVYRKPVTASAEQIAKFAKLFPNNARPVQPLNRRKLLLDLL